MTIVISLTHSKRKEIIMDFIDKPVFAKYYAGGHVFFKGKILFDEQGMVFVSYTHLAGCNSYNVNILYSSICSIDKLGKAIIGKHILITTTNGVRYLFSLRHRNKVASFIENKSNLYITIQDTDIFAVNHAKAANEASGLVYRDDRNELHSIDFELCANNYKVAHPESSGCCIGNRNICGWYFILYTSGIQTKIMFKRSYVWSKGIRYHCLGGSKRDRFHTLQKFILEAGYSTYDIS